MAISRSSSNSHFCDTELLCALPFLAGIRSNLGSTSGGTNLQMFDFTNIRILQIFANTSKKLANFRHTLGMPGRRCCVKMVVLSGCLQHGRVFNVKLLNNEHLLHYLKRCLQVIYARYTSLFRIKGVKLLGNMFSRQQPNGTTWSCIFSHLWLNCRLIPMGYTVALKMHLRY